MAQNIIFDNTTYNNVPEVQFKTPSGATASFLDTSGATATASDILKGKTAFVNGAQIIGNLVNQASSGSGVVIEEVALEDTAKVFVPSTISGRNFIFFSWPLISSFHNTETLYITTIAEQPTKQLIYSYGGWQPDRDNYLLIASGTSDVCCKQTIASSKELFWTCQSSFSIAYQSKTYGTEYESLECVYFDRDYIYIDIASNVEWACSSKKGTFIGWDY